MRFNNLKLDETDVKIEKILSLVKRHWITNVKIRLDVSNYNLEYCISGDISDEYVFERIFEFESER